MYDGHNWQRIPLPSIGYVTELTGDANGRVWMAGGDGVAVYDPAH